MILTFTTQRYIFTMIRRLSRNIDCDITFWFYNGSEDVCRIPNNLTNLNAVTKNLRYLTFQHKSMKIYIYWKYAELYLYT